MELQHESHPHPLVFHQSEDTFHCSGCEGEVLGPCFSCEECGFYLHKNCAEAPMEIDHPFHPRHPLILLLPSPADDEEKTCHLCWNIGMGFFYHCPSCEIDIDFNCALLPRDTAGNFIQTLHFAHKHPLTLIANGNNHLDTYDCEDCSSELVYDSFACFKCFIFFHKKCVELPIEIPSKVPSQINHPYHRKHQLILEFENNYCVCNLCQRHHRGYFYRCSLCNVDIHSECAWQPSIVEDKNHHEHPFTLLLRPNSFTCDACGTHGNNVSYICSTCNIQIHRDCISHPRFIRINLHHHPISRNFSLCIGRHDSRTWDCRICYKKVNVEHGSYYCSQPDCDFVIHVKCATENESLYGIIELENKNEIEKHKEELALLYNKSMDCITNVIRTINIGEDEIAAEIEHISHGHNLMFSNEIVDDKHCNGCVLPILPSFYYCSQCDFFLHKACAELPRKTLLWSKARPLTLNTNGIFVCWFCNYRCTGFSYRADDDDVMCLRCAALSHSFTYQAREAHYLFFDENYEDKCSVCGGDDSAFFLRCKDCDFVLDVRCVTLPQTVWNKCDEHSLRIAYGDDNDYPLQHYCDICEERRDPKHWYYHCEVCNTVVHPKCVLGKYPFIKRGSNYTHEDHPHPLTFVQKIYDYPQCVDCDMPCEDLSLECVGHGCNYVVHWKCIKPVDSSDDESSSSSGSDSSE